MDHAIGHALPLDLLSIFIVALVGGVHCVGMCGGIVGALTLGLPESVRCRPGALLAFQLAYNVGRVASYALAGALAGALGAWLATRAGVEAAQHGLRALAGLLMVALGLYLAGWWRGLAALERLGGRLWRHIEPLGRRLLPVRAPGQALALGAVWGWLPCGLVYSALAVAATAGGAASGAAVMLVFGAGTLPALLALGSVAGALAAAAQRPWLRRVAGALVLGYGLWSLVVLARAVGAG